MKYSKNVKMKKIQHFKLWDFHTQKFNWYLSITIFTWITKPYSIEEYGSKREYKFKNEQYMKTKIRNFFLNLKKNLWQKLQLGLNQGINTH